MRTIRSVLLGISGAGFLLCGAAFVLSYVRPLLIEQYARELVRREVEARVQERIAALDGTRLGRLAQRVIRRNEKLAAELPAKVAAAVVQMQDPNCECRKFLARTASSLMTLDLLSRTAANEHLLRLIRTKYAEVVQGLLREFRIFTAANALVFLLLGLTTYYRRAAGLQLLLPALVLVGAAVLVGAFYLFGQDWLHTILFSDYVGLGYFA